MRTFTTQKLRASRGTSLRFENLETRAMLAGNVKASVTGGTLNIVGDSKANQIQVYQSGNQWKVQGLGTTVNGSNSIKTFSGAQSIIIELRGGDDFVRAFNGTLPGSLLCVDSFGSVFKSNDIVQISNIRSAFIQAVTDDGADNVLIEKSRATFSIQALTAFGETGSNDVVTILNCTAPDNIGVFTGGGSDAVVVSGVTTGALSIFTHEPSRPGDGNDSVSLVNIRATDSAFIETGEGVDSVAVTNLTATNFQLNLGSGNDVAALAQITLAGGLLIDADSGTDVVTLSRVIAGDSFEVTMGSGNNDRLTVAQCTTENADFDGGGNPGDTLILSLNTFANLDFDDFQFVIGA